MRCLILFLTIATTGLLSAQTKVDTIYDRWGEVNQIRYLTKLEVAEMSRADLFQRGLMPNSSGEVWQTDSVQVFDKDGESKLLKEPNEMSKVSSRVRASYKDPVKAAAIRRTLANAISTTTDYVEGRAGMLVRRKIPKGENVKDIKRLDESPEIELMENLEGENGEIIVKVRIPAGSTQRKLVLDSGDGKKWEKLYTIRGYHLNETDFKRKDKLTAEQSWYAKGRHYLYLRLRSTEKLLYISQGETRYTPVPVGRQLDEVYLKELPAGKYLLEIIDLGSREKRYHWLVVGD